MSSIETAGDRGVGLLFLLPSNTVSTANSVRLAYRRETGEASSHGRYAQTDLMGSHRAVPIKGFAQGGDPDATSSAHCAAKKIAEEGRLQQFRPSGFCRSLSDRHDRQIDGTGSAQFRKRIAQRGVAAGSIRQECLDHVVVFGERQQTHRGVLHAGTIKRLHSQARNPLGSRDGYARRDHGEGSRIYWDVKIE